MDSEGIVRKCHQKRGRIRKKFIPDPGGKKAPDPGSGSATLVRNIELNSTVLFLSKEYLNRSITFFLCFVLRNISSISILLRGIQPTHVQRY
jgi:hypothetical protein